MKKLETIRSHIWREEPEPDNPFAAASCHCHGYDVYGDVLGNAGWIEFLYLLFKGERPSAAQCKLLEDLAVALANAGPRDHAVHAAMSGGVSGSHSAACLMAALAVGAGQLGGAKEVANAMALWDECGTQLDVWQRSLAEPAPSDKTVQVWPDTEHPAGFDPHGASCATPVLQTLHHLASNPCARALAWLRAHREDLESAAGCPLAMTGVAAAAFRDLEFSNDQSEMLFLLLRLPGAAAHALEQRESGYRHFPFFGAAVRIENDPGPYQANGEVNHQLNESVA